MSGELFTRTPEQDAASSNAALALADSHAARLPNRLPRWSIEGSLFAAFSSAINDRRPNLITRDGDNGFQVDPIRRELALIGFGAIPYSEFARAGAPWRCQPLTEGRVDGAGARARWDALDGLRFIACLLESEGRIAGPIELGRRYKMRKWPDLGALPAARAILRPYLRHATSLARGNRSIGEVLASAGGEWRQALAFANACAMLDLLEAVEEPQPE